MDSAQREYDEERNSTDCTRQRQLHAKLTRGRAFAQELDQRRSMLHSCLPQGPCCVHRWQ